MIPIGLPAFNPGPMTGAGNWTWLLPGRVPTLVDAGMGDPRHLDALTDALGGGVLLQVVVTHGHADHAAGAAAIAARLPHVRFLKMPWAPQDVRWGVEWEPLADGDVIAAGDASLTVVHTPGHAPDHVCLWHEETRSVFGGDLARSDGTIGIFPDDGDLAAYLASLERVLALNPARLFPGHGGIVGEPAALLRRYIAHRRAREAQILAAVRAGATDPDAIVARVYEGLDPRALPYARATAVAHLIKLEREHRVVRRGDAWHIMGP